MTDPDQPNDPKTEQRPRRHRNLGLAVIGALLFATVLLRVTSAQLGARAGLPALPNGIAAGLMPATAAPAAVPVARAGGSAVSLGVALDRTAVHVGGDGLVRMELTMKADEGAGTAARVDSDFVVVFDRSGSMAGDRLEQARAAVLGLLDQLSPRDRFALVVYDDAAEVAVPLAEATATAKANWRRAIARIDAGDSTNMSDGLDQGLALLAAGRKAGRAGRLMLLSDGHANTGDASPEGLRARGKRAMQNELVLSTIGIGEGFNEYLMTQIADAGTGNYYYLAENGALASILERELSSTRETVATGLAVRIPNKPGVQVIDAGGYPLQRDHEGTIFQVGSLFAGQERKVWLTLRVPSQRAGSVALGGVELAFTEGGKRKALAAGEALAIGCVKDEKAALASIDRGAWERAVVNEEWGKVQEEVARAVHEGKRDEALKRLGDYRAGYTALNASIGSAAVGSSLAESDALRQKVEDAFQGADQYGKQNVFSKEQLSKGRKGRRIGSEKQSKAVVP